MLSKLAIDHIQEIPKPSILGQSSLEKESHPSRPSCTVKYFKRAVTNNIIISSIIRL